MIFQKFLYTEEGRGNIDRARQILMSQFNLVPPKDDGFGRTEKDLLVWEDSQGVGRYRVHFYLHQFKRGKYRDWIRFSYWLNQERAEREIFEQDPMKAALSRVLESIEGLTIEDPDNNVIGSIDDAMQGIFQ